MDSNNSAIQEFRNSEFHVRTINDNGETWFVAKDIAEALEYERFDSNLIKSVPEIWKGTKRIRTPGGEQEMVCLTEQGVYFFLGRSDKKKALPYQMWIAGEVLPAIRKTGAYSVNGDMQKQLHKLEAENILLREKVDAMLEQPDRKRSAFLMGYQFDVPFTDLTRNRFRSVQNCRGNSEVRGTLGQYAIIPNDP